MSRAYYAAYNYAMDYATAYLGFLPRTKPEERSQDHGRLNSHLKARRRHQAGNHLEYLRDLRNPCDYHGVIVPALDLQTAQDALATADQLLASLPPPPPRTP